MPLKTFFNLPAEKRELITYHAMNEFYEQGYEKASISRIVAKTKIAKGSFYQYFENMNDLYSYILQVISFKKLEYSSSIFQHVEESSLIEIVRELFISGIRFYFDHPKFSAIMSDFMKGRSKIHKEHKEKSINTGNDFFKKMIDRKKQKGEIAADVDSATLADMIAFLSMYFAENIAGRFAAAEKEIIAAEIEKMLRILKQGIQTNERGV